MTNVEMDQAFEALDALNTACRQFASAIVDLDIRPVEEQLALARGLETARNQWAAVDLAILAALDRSGVAETLCQGNLRRVLSSALGISKAEASRRVHAYEQLGSRRSMLGEELGAVRPVLAAAVTAGEVSMEKAAIITRGLRTVDRAGFDPADIAAAEEILVDDARLFSPEELRLLTQRVVDAIDPDGTRPDESLQKDRRSFEMHRTSDGGFAGQFRLTAECGIKLDTLLRPLSARRVDDPHADRGDDVAAGRAKLIDERSFGQRQHDALEECCNRLLREGTVHENNAPVTVIVTIDETDLVRRTGHATTTSGDLIATPTLLTMADQAEIYPAVLNAHGVPLTLERTKRCATRHQTMALIARDVGCSFPGCAHPADYCERHHIVPWIDGGPTDLDNLTLLCVYHHRNFEQRGWTVRMNDQGLPEWRPPAWVDPDQKPLINGRIRAAHGGGRGKMITAA